jgi:hypothetical protein
MRSLATKQQHFQDVEERCEACGELIGDGTDWWCAIYHHRRLVSDPNVSDKEACSAANCIRRATRIRSIFIACTVLSGQSPKEVGKRNQKKAGESASVHFGLGKMLSARYCMC